MLHDALVNAVAKVFNGGSASPHDNRRVVVGHLAAGLGVDANKRQVVPGLLEQRVEVPLKMRANGHPVG